MVYYSMYKHFMKNILLLKVYLPDESEMPAALVFAKQKLSTCKSWTDESVLALYDAV